MLNVHHKIEVKKQGAALGAYIYNVDLSKRLDAPTFELILRTLRDSHVVGLRNQNITPKQHLAFTEMFGELQPATAGMEHYPEITEIKGPSLVADRWHSDHSHAVRPPRIQVLVARTVPEFGNDLMFANQLMAYERLSPAMQRMLAPLRAVHRITMKTGEIEENVHPVVRTHPNTGRKALFVNRQYTRQLEGMKEEESLPLLDFLYRHGTQPHLTWRHYWREGDVLIWDNASVLHLVVCDVPQETSRVIHRTITRGEVPL